MTRKSGQGNRDEEGFAMISSPSTLSEKMANDERVEGYRDGLRADIPEPGTNRSYSYRHGFSRGRVDIRHKADDRSLAEICRAADAAMSLDRGGCE